MHRSRRGFSLMEVMLSTSILVGSSIVLIELATIGRKQANSAYDLNTAQLLCQAKLNELVAKTIPVKSIQEEELEDNPGWMYSVEIETARHRRLVSVKVTVSQNSDETLKPASFTLVRWLPDAILESADNMTQKSSRGSSSDDASPNSRGAVTEAPSTGPRRNSRREESP